MSITQRQEQLLWRIVQNYIEEAKPVSSEFLEKEYDLGIRSAAIRIEMQKLADMGYLSQPHTSAGRIPTNKAYRLFVSKLGTAVEENMHFNEQLFAYLHDINRKTDNLFQFTRLLTRELAEISSNLAFTYLYGKDILWKDGWKEVFQNPELRDAEHIEGFVEAVERFEENLKDFAEHRRIMEGVQVYIGKEQSLLDSSELSVVVTRGKFPQEEEGFFALLGPKRMPYERNINLLSSLIRELEQL